MAKKNDLERNKNEDRMRLLVSGLERKLDLVKKGGGATRIEKEHAKGKMTARERLSVLFDPECNRFELGALVGDGLLHEWQRAHVDMQL